MKFTSDISEATKQSQVIFIAVGTPELPDGLSRFGAHIIVLREVCAAGK